MKKLFIFCLLYVQLLVSDEYVYPVANIDDTSILMMHQKSVDELELFAVDIATQTRQKILSALYFPSSVTVLPGKKSYSFIDRGRIYIKEFLKRAPRALEIYQPICDIQSSQWINDHQLIFSARFKKHYKIFMYDTSQEKMQLYSLCCLNDEVNYIFPSSVDQENLFCLVQHDTTELYQIAHLKINPIAWDAALDKSQEKSNLTIISVDHKKPLCFLKMINFELGYVLELTSHNHDSKFFTFTAHKITISKSQLDKLFEFTIPEQFIIGMGNDRFYESLYPLLPYYQQSEIYFTSFDTTSQKLKLYAYDINTKAISLYPIYKNLQNKHIFAPLIVQDKLHLGQSL